MQAPRLRTGGLVANGGRVLAVTAVADTFANARARAYRAVDQIDFADGFHRRDIGWRELATGECMNPLWNYLWPVFSLGLIARRSGRNDRRSVCPSRLVLMRANALRRRLRRKRRVALAAVQCCPSQRLVCGMGRSAAADRFSTPIERGLHNCLVDYEMTRVTANLHHGPLTRDVLLSGPADDFQRSELVAAYRVRFPASERALVGRWRRAAAHRRGLRHLTPGLSFGPAARLSRRASPSLQRTMELVT